MRKLPALVLVLALLALPAVAGGSGEEPAPENPTSFSFTLAVDWFQNVTAWLGLGSDPEPNGEASIQTQGDGAPDADSELGPYVVPSG